MKNNVKLKLKHLLVSICLLAVGALLFTSTAYAAGTILSTETNIGSGYHSSSAVKYGGSYGHADHDTTQWQELGYSGGLGDYGVTWSADGGLFGHDDLYVGQTVTFRFNMHSGDVGTHYANFLKGWIDWGAADDTYEFNDSNDVITGFKELRDEGYYSYGHWHDGDLLPGYAPGDVQVDYTLTLTQANLGTAYLRARVTCSESLAHNSLNTTDWSQQWDYDPSTDYITAFSAYTDYGQGEIEDWKFTVFNSNNPVPEPATLALFGMGLIGLARVGRKKA